MIILILYTSCVLYDQRPIGNGGMNMTNVLIEVIGLNLDDVIQAEKGGADRIELCQSIVEDGLTPSYGLVKSAVEITKIPIHVMIRPHNHSFVYHSNDVKIMIEDIRMIRQLGANGIVLGPLTDEGLVDEVVLEQLLNETEGLQVTFHRAFDVVSDQQKALDTILQYEQITTVLTSGGGRSAFDSTARLQELMDRTKETHLTIMPGGGLRVEGLETFYQSVPAKALHFGVGVRVDCHYEHDISSSQIKRVRQATKGII